MRTSRKSPPIIGRPPSRPSKEVDGIDLKSRQAGVQEIEEIEWKALLKADSGGRLWSRAGTRRAWKRGGRSRWLLAAALLAFSVMAMAAFMTPQDPQPEATKDWAGARQKMVKEQITKRGIQDPRVLRAMELVPRHHFVPEALDREAHRDSPLGIGFGQTISQPYIVAFMTELLDLRGDERVLEIGTGSGYHAAVLSRVAAEVYSIEIVEELAQRADATLRALGYENIHLRIGDGYRGWPEAAPFDAIILTAAPLRIPEPLLDQLRVGGRLVLPLGGAAQDLVVLTKTPTGIERRIEAAVRFVPMTGEVQRASGGG